MEYPCGIFPTHRGDIPLVDKGGRINPPYSSACRKSRLKEAGAQGWEPLSTGSRVERFSTFLSYFCNRFNGSYLPEAHLL